MTKKGPKLNPSKFDDDAITRGNYVMISKLAPSYHNVRFLGFPKTSSAPIVSRSVL